MAEQTVETPKEPVKQETPKERIFNQEQVNNYLAYEKKKWAEEHADYDQLKAQAAELAKFKEEQNNKELEAKKEYEKLKDAWLSREKEYQNQIVQRDNSLRDMQINHQLTQEVVNQNGYPDTVKLIKDFVTVDKDGVVRIKGRNEQGIETELDVVNGVKSFLKDRPYLVKAKGTGGAGTSTATNDGKTGSVGDDLDSLNDQYMTARNAGNHKLATEIKTKIAATLGSRGINRSI